MPPSSQVFISYARDGGVSEQTATAMHERLTEAGIAVFRDVESIDPGSHWAAVIEQQILASRLMVVVVSQDALDPQRWVMRECLYASGKRIPIIPVLVERVELPLWLTHINALDFTHSQQWSRFLLTVGKHVEVQTAAEKVIKPQPKPVSPPKTVVPLKPQIKQPEPLHIPEHSLEVQRLLQELQNPKTQPPRRLEIGNRLNVIGDTRPGVGLDAKTGLPDIDWVKIPAGVFTYQQGERLHLDDFWISRYPVTNRQFQAFEQAGGYEKDAWWEVLKKPDEWWKGLKKPDELPNHRWMEANRPVENVNWYESMAFCRWLSVKTGLEIRLPTEQQWEKTARGADGRQYPWGDRFESERCNAERKLGETSAVGIYPQGQSPFGLMDMAGNVREWCLNKWDNPQMITADVSDSSRVVRGGSWNNLSENCRSSSRYYWHPLGRYLYQGFRVVLCLFPHSSH